MTLYDKLEVSEKASSEVIEKAYKTLAKKYHPDVQTTSEEIKNAEEKMKEINEAYSILKDEAKRSEYDSKLQSEREKELARNIARQTSDNELNYKKQQTYSNTQTGQYQTNYQRNSDWQNILANMSPKEKEKLKKKIQREAREEYTRVAEDYYRQKGYRVKHKTTWSEYKARALAVLIMIGIAILLWIIPFTRNWLISIYEGNAIIKILVDIVINFVKAIFSIKL